MADIRAIVGPMRSGKSERAIALIRRMKLAGKKVMVLKPAIDTRSVNTIASRLYIDNKPVVSESERAILVGEDDYNLVLLTIGEQLPDTVIVDEGQFMPKWFAKVALFVSNGLDIPVYIFGLDLDAWLRPFGVMPDLCAIAEEVEKLQAVCNHCKSFEGRYTQKLSGSSDQVEVGDEIYEPRCKKCHYIPTTP